MMQSTYFEEDLNFLANNWSGHDVSVDGFDELFSRGISSVDKSTPKAIGGFAQHSPNRASSPITIDRTFDLIDDYVSSPPSENSFHQLKQLSDEITKHLKLVRDHPRITPSYLLLAKKTLNSCIDDLSRCLEIIEAINR